MIRQDCASVEVSIPFISSFDEGVVLPQRAVEGTERMDLGRQRQRKQVPLPVES